MQKTTTNKQKTQKKDSCTFCLTVYFKSSFMPNKFTAEW